MVLPVMSGPASLEQDHLLVGRRTRYHRDHLPRPFTHLNQHNIKNAITDGRPAQNGCGCLRHTDETAGAITAYRLGGGDDILSWNSQHSSASSLRDVGTETPPSSSPPPEYARINSSAPLRHNLDWTVRPPSCRSRKVPAPDYPHSHHQNVLSPWGRLVALTFLSLTLLLAGGPVGGPRGAAALWCETCDRSQCTNLTDCLGGVTLDVCDCCPRCARVVNQSCGGPYGILGRCDKDLYCFIQNLNSHEREGVCKDISNENNCEEPPCPQRDEESFSMCPPDSYLVTNSGAEHNNNNNDDNGSAAGDALTRIDPDATLDKPNSLSNSRPSLPPPPPPSLLSHSSSFFGESSSSSSSNNQPGSGQGRDDFSNTNTYTNDDDDDDLVSNGEPDISSYNSLSPHSLGDVDAPLDEEEDQYLKTNMNHFNPDDNEFVDVDHHGSSQHHDIQDDDYSADYYEYSVADMPTSFCVCNMSTCSIPQCEEGHVLSMVHKAEGFPGSCCDKFECKIEDHGELLSPECVSVICPAVSEDECPVDSHRPPPIWSKDHCCELQGECMCKPPEECEPAWCPDGFQIQITSRASRTPGNCCDKFRCVNVSGLTCTYKGKQLKNGETWDIDKCKTCECRDGLNRCKDKMCQNLSCTWMVKPAGECCHVCRGCASDSGVLHNESDVWRENDCTTCTCKDGHAQCQAEMCAVSCANPIKVPGQCCPVCPEEEDVALVPHLCFGMDTCDLSCPHGLEQAFDGCFLCRCKQERCVLECPDGFKSDVEGRTLCECREASELLPLYPHENCPEREEDCGKKCEYGFQRTADGCFKCKCNRCPPQAAACNKTCLHGFVTNDDGCELCKCKDAPAPSLLYPSKPPEEKQLVPFLNPPPSLPKLRHCLSSSGAQHEEGESWNDSCRVCYCHAGHEMCSLIACPAPHCLNPVYRVGDCCPTCPGIVLAQPVGDQKLCHSSEGGYYVEGETWDLDPCTQCVCHGGAILCQTSTCAAVLCHHPIKSEKSCCPSCRGDPLALPATPTHPKPCKSPTGRFFRHQEAWKPTPCQSCVCQNGEINCYSQMCPPLPCSQTVSRKGECCPTCSETRIPPVCIYNGLTYKVGEEWQGDNCTQCLCVDGETKCFPLSCPHPQCSVMIVKRGQCCPVCYDTPVLEAKDPVQAETGSPLNDTEDKETIDEAYMNQGSHGNDVQTAGQSQVDAYVVYILIILVIALIVALVVVIYVFWWRRRHSQNRSPRFRPRPKSTNLELQGHIPFIPPDTSGGGINGGGGGDVSDLKGVSAEKQLLEKLCSGLVVERETRASNPYTEMRFGDQGRDGGKGNNAGHFLSNVKT